MLDISEARQFAQGSIPLTAGSAQRRRPVVVAPQDASTSTELQSTPPVVRPLRRVVRPRGVPVAEPAESESALVDEAREQVADGAQDPDMLDQTGAESEDLPQDDVQEQEEGDVITQ